MRRHEMVLFEGFDDRRPLGGRGLPYLLALPPQDVFPAPVPQGRGY